MLPLTFLATMLALTLAAFAGHLFLRRRICCRLRHLAAEWRMHFAEDDRFQITPRVREKFPVPGASDVCVKDLIYRVEAEHFRYFFRVEYTEGVVRTKKRVCRVATFCESRDRACPIGWSPLIFAPRSLPLEEQYARLRELAEPGARPSEPPLNARDLKSGDATP